MTQPRCVVWTNPEQAQALSRVLHAAGIELIGAGCPDPARTGQTASALSCPALDDLRQVLHTSDADVLLLGDPGVFGEYADDADLEALRAAHSRNLSVGTLEPIPASAAGIGGTAFAEVLHQGSMCGLSAFLPLTRHNAVIDELSGVLETFAPIRSCSLTIASPKALGSLGAKLFDSMDLVRWLIGVPSIIEAAYISPSAGRGMHPLPGQTLRGLHGEITMNLRFSDGRCAAVLLSDQLATNQLGLTLIGAEGMIHLNSKGFVWTNPSGEAIDQHTAPSSDGQHGESEFQTQLIDLCTGVAPTRTPIDYTAVLSMTHAALLSTRTGQGESPHDIEQLMLSM